MSGEPDLSRHRILVIEDDYFLATDAARALLSAGAIIVGPCPTEGAARAQLDGERPDAAVVDINLGPGPSFELAKLLTERGIPFVFLTGYDQQIIPDGFTHITRLEKPIQSWQLVEAISRSLGSAP
ncbi:MAG: response regulator [Acetobacteraceae bacterium]|nr:response regulator [Acetobacteraceae bacterium]